MNPTNTLILIVYLLIVTSLLWGRFRFFNIKSSQARIGSLFYDPIVAIQVIVTLFLLFERKDIPLSSAVICLFFYLSGLFLFWWSITTAKNLDFAFSDKVGKILKIGPFSYVRHPFYLSYLLVWAGSSLLFNSISLWITLIYLLAFYVTSAKTEERAISNSKFSKEYQQYSQNVGMFIPRIKLCKK